ncbi:MAG: energy-coupling factor transport system ATP-binding protein [Frankiaceae bacterium]|nr:energy-coupling factor transport system ATP-binding protein [Frankiaceae bacterium]
MIRFESVTATYPDATTPALRDVNLDIAAGQLCLVVGSTGSGKSTLLKCVNGLMPHFTGGTLHGVVSVAGRDTRTHRPRELADAVGYVGQDPVAGFVTDTVEDELAYGMESLGVPPATMRRRVEETLDLLGLADVRNRPLLTLSAGQQQRVAIGSVLVMHPQVLVLDEPTSALDPPAAEEVLAALTRLVHDLGVTVLVAEHRLERVVQYADLVVHVPGGGAPVEVGPPVDVMRTSPVAPPVVRLGRAHGWAPLPLSVRDARTAAAPLRAALAAVDVPAPVPAVGRDVANATKLTVGYDGIVALRSVDLRVRAGEIVAVMGRNGAGKSSLLSAFAGLRPPTAGTVDVDGVKPWTLPAKEAVRRVGLIPQQPGDLLWADTVGRECADVDRDAGVAAGTTAGLVRELAGPIDKYRHPRDLSEGQRLALALAVVLAAAPPLLLLDEPTRGLDYEAKERLVRVLRGLAAGSRAIVFATHDVELVAEVATRVVVLAEGDVVSDGPAATVVTDSPAFAPQVAKIVAPQRFLTVAAVEAALA